MFDKEHQLMIGLANFYFTYEEGFDALYAGIRKHWTTPEFTFRDPLNPTHVLESFVTTFGKMLLRVENRGEENQKLLTISMIPAEAPSVMESLSWLQRIFVTVGMALRVKEGRLDAELETATMEFSHNGNLLTFHVGKHRLQQITLHGSDVKLV